MIRAADGSAVLFVTALCALILVLGETAHRALRLEPEWTRKLVHVLMGLTASAFPWLFRDSRSVVLVCAAFAVALGASLAFSKLPSVHRVGRRTGGAVWFPVAVACLFVAAGGRADLYVIPMLVLTLADPAAAVVGRGRGAHRWAPGLGPKTREGSLAFFVVAAASLLIALAVTSPLSSAEICWRAFGIAFLLTAVELVSRAGSDNFLVPVAGFLLLRASAHA